MRKLSLIACSAVCAVALAAGDAASAAMVKTSTGTGADTYVSNDSLSAATVVHGAETSANVRAVTDTRARASLLRFDLSGLSGDMSGATLTLDFVNANRARTWNVYGLNDSSAGENWEESTLNYNSAPGFLTATQGNVAFDVGTGNNQYTLLGTFAAPAATSTVTSVTASLNLDSFLAADTNDAVTLLLAFPTGTATDPDWKFNTKEATLASAVVPTLTIPNATEVPEPAVASLLAVAGVGLLGRRRR